MFFNYIKEKGSYCNFPKLHLVKIYGKVLERHEFGEVSVVEIFEVVNRYLGTKLRGRDAAGPSRNFFPKLIFQQHEGIL